MGALVDRSRRMPRLAAVVLAGGLAVLVSGVAAYALILGMGKPAPPGVRAVDTASGAGSASVITIGADGLGLVAYHAGGTYAEATGWTGTGQVKVAHCGNVACTSVSKTVVAQDADLSGTIGLAIDRNGHPFITYYRAGSQDLVAIQCTSKTCSLKTTATVVAAGNVGRASAVAIDPFGLPVIAFYDDTTNGLKVARCGNVSCSAASVEVVHDPPGDYPDAGNPGLLADADDFGRGLSIAVDPNGDPVISYGVDPTAGEFDSFDIWVAKCRTVNLDEGGGPWSYDCADDDATPVTKTNLGTTDVSLGHTGIVIGTDGLPFVTSFFKAWHCETPSCAPEDLCEDEPPVCETVPGATRAGPGYGGWGGNSRPAVGADGLITFLGSIPQAGPLVPPILHCVDAACSRWTSTGIVGLSPSASLTIGADGLPLIADQILADDAPPELQPGEGLEITHCTNPFCTPYFRRH